MISKRDKILALVGRLFSVEESHIRVEILPKRGSQRDFFRLFLPDGKSIIAIAYDPSRIENTYYSGILRFLRTIGLFVPTVIYEAKKDNILILEDLGNIDLFSIRSLDWEKKRPFYEKAISSIAKLHRYPLEKFPFKQVKICDGFDAALYAKERMYFIENFISNLLNIEIEPLLFKELENEFESLTSALMNGPSSLIHRDFQSQNIILKENETYFIDFQGMRRGNPLYDVGSLVFDPYVSLSEKQRDELIEFYYSEHNLKLSLEETREILFKASIQRLMQALGAFGFLSKKMGLSHYLLHVPQALKNLYFLLSEDKAMTKLKELVVTSASILGIDLHMR